MPSPTPPIDANLGARLRAVVPRARRFYEAATPGHFLIAVHVPREWPPVPKLTEVDVTTPAGLGAYLDARLESDRIGFLAKEGLDDDTVPCVAPFFGYSEHTAWLGGKVNWQEATSLSEPFLEENGPVEALDVQPASEGFRRMQAAYQHLRRRQDGSFLLAMRGCASPMELANSVRGDALFQDFLENPAFVHRLLRRLTDIYPRYLNLLRSWADPVEDGHLFWFHGGWFGPDAMGHLSNDAAMLCSRAIYEEFGRPYEEELTAHWRHILFHVHTQHLHYLPELVKLDRLRLLQLQEDPGVGSNFAILDRLLAHTGNANLMLAGSAEEVRAHLDRLRERNVFFRAFCASREEARDLIALVRDRSH